MRGPSPEEEARYDATVRELFGSGCTEAFHRSRSVNLPYLQAQRGDIEKLESEIAWRMRWRRVKRWATSREVWLTFVALLLASAFMAGRVFASNEIHQQGDERRSYQGARESCVAGGCGAAAGLYSESVGLSRQVRTRGGSPMQNRAPAPVLSPNCEPDGVAPIRDLGALPRHTDCGGLRGDDLARRGEEIPQTGRGTGARGRRGEEATPSPAPPAHTAAAGHFTAAARDAVTQLRVARSTPEPCPLPFGDSAQPLVSPERFEACREESIAALKRDAGFLKILGGVALVVTSAILLRRVWYADMEPQDDGQVLPRRGRW